MSDEQEIVRVLAEIRRRGLPQASDEMLGPTSASNIVIPGLLLWGDAPKGKKLAELLEYGVTQFFDVRPPPTDLYLPEDPNLQHHQLDLGSFLSAGSTHLVAKFVKSLLARVITSHSILYVHCSDGHTLSGMVVCAILSYIFGLTMLKSASICAQLHSCRLDTDTMHQLFNTSQKAFLRDLCADNSAISAHSESQHPSGRTLEGSMSNDQLRQLSHEAQMNAVAGAGTKGSRFEHSLGAGGGKTTLNLFEASTGGDDTPTRRGRALVPGISPETLQAGQRRSSDVQHLGSARSSVPTQDSHGCQLPLRSAPMEAAEATTTVTVMMRSSHEHAWGLLLAGNTVRRVLPRSPAQNAGLAPRMTVLFVDDEPLEAGEDFDWLTMGKTAVTLVIGDGHNVVVHRPLSASAVEHQQQHLSSAPNSRENSPKSDSSATNAGAFPKFDPSRDRQLIAGPTPTTNWVVPRHLLCGPQPEPRHRANFEALARERFDVIVSLVENEAAPQSYLGAYEQLANKKVRRVLTLPLQDGKPLTDANAADVLALASEIEREIRSGSKVYVHCKGGHGRTGMIVSCVLAKLYNLPGMRAVNLCDTLHSCRADTEDYSSPENQEQRLSVISLLSNN